MLASHDHGEKITDRDLQRVMAARRALRQYAPYAPPPGTTRRSRTPLRARAALLGASGLRDRADPAGGPAVPSGARDGSVARGRDAR